jgi:hypothetical protein
MRAIAAAVALIACAILLVACGSGSATTVETGESMGIGPPPTPLKKTLAKEERTGDAAARHFAERDAARRLGEAPIPPDAHSAEHLPKSLGLDRADLRPATPNFVARSALYLSPLRPTEVINWFEAHPPPHVAGLAMDSEGGASVEHAFTFGDLEGKVSQRWLTVAAVERPGGGSAIRLDSQGVWVTPHPPIERIPSGPRRDHQPRRTDAARGARLPGDALRRRDPAHHLPLHPPRPAGREGQTAAPARLRTRARAEDRWRQDAAA